MAKIYKIDIKNYNDFINNLSIYEKVNDSIIFFGLNVGSGIEISSKRYIDQLYKSVENKDIQIFWIYEQGFSEDQLFSIIENIVNYTNVIYSFDNEPHEKTVQIIQKLKNRNKIYFKTFANIHSLREHEKNDIQYLYTNIFTPIYKNLGYLNKVIGIAPTYFPFIQGENSYIIPYNLRTNNQLLPKRICEQFTNVEKVQKIINNIDFFTDLKLIHNIQDQNKLDELKEKSLKPIIYLKNYPDKDVGIIYNQFKYFLHFPKQELFGIFSIDQMSNGVFPIQSISEENQNNDFGLLEVFNRHGVWLKEYLSEEENLNEIKNFISQPDEKLLELQIEMINDIHNKFSEERQVNMFKQLF